MRTPRPVSIITTVVIVALGLGGMAITGLTEADDVGTSLRRAPRPEVAAAGREAADFLDEYVTAEGRVVRYDQGGDTVSEGQAYAMLLAVGSDDEARFATIWDWTEQNLQRSDWLLAWQWADGGVVDEAPAADADLDAAWALTLAEERWPDRGYGEAAARMAEAITEHETVDHADPDAGHVLAAGPWAIEEEGVVVNPSYSSPVAEAVLAEAGHVGGRVAAERTDGSRAVVLQLMEQDGLPSDWARLKDDGSVEAISGPGEGAGGGFGFDAVRVPIRWASSCDGEDRSVATELWDDLSEEASGALQGHPGRIAAAAAAAAAAGEGDTARDLLEKASDAADARPSYYGDALVALTRLLLDTERLGGCPPLGS